MTYVARFVSGNEQVAYGFMMSDQADFLACPRRCEAVKILDLENRSGRPQTLVLFGIFSGRK
jgi:hypothetical protein